MRILILSNLDLGLYKFRKELLEELAKDNEVYFCTPKGDYTVRIEELGCNYLACNTLKRRSKNPLSDIQLASFYFKIIKIVSPDLVLTYTIKPNVYGGLACRLLKTKYIANVTGLGTAIENGGMLSKLTLELCRIGLKNSECVFFQNIDNQELLTKKKVVKGRNRLIPGSGVNLEKHNYEPYPNDKFGYRFLFVGRIMKDKGIEELVHAISELRKKRNDVILDIVGFCDEDYSELLKESEKKGIIEYHGVQEDVHLFYRSCHCVILPSYHEGMANVLLEASSTGRPIIATRISGCKEIFEEGVTGLGCEPRDSNSLFNAITCFLNLSQNEREKMGFLARKKMENEFDRSIVVKSYLDEISRIERKI